MSKKLSLVEKCATMVSAEGNKLPSSGDGDDVSHIAELLDMLREVVDKVSDYHGGRMVQFAGRSFILLFSDRKNDRENAASALDAILEIQRRLTSLAPEINSQEPVAFCAGVSSGKIFLPTPDSATSGKETYFGDTVDLAIKISHIANAGQVLTDATTHNLCKDQFTFQFIEPIPVKGIAQSLSLFRLISKNEGKSIPSAGPGRLIQSKMVGREKEIDLLISLTVELTHGKGGIINIIGAPGTGKSRLVNEMKKEKVMEKILWLEGRGLSHGQNLGYHPFSMILKSWAKIKDGDTTALAEKKLKDEIAKVNPQEQEDVYPFIARLMGLNLSGQASGGMTEVEPEVLDKLMIKAIRALMTRITRLRPVVIAIEDLHWADRSSLSLLKSLVELAAGVPILFINILRPGYEKSSGPFIKYLEKHHEKYLITLRIENLSSAFSEKLIENLLHSVPLPSSISSIIISKTKGNPFFIEEVIRSLIDQNIIELKENNFLVNEQIKEANIPETISEVLLARVNNLDEKTRSLLDTASVIGRNVYFKVLDEAADTIGEVSERLQYLKNMQFIQESGDEENLEFVFKHALAHQATYDSMMDRKRKELHMKIAEAIEKVFPERINEFYGTLAMHYSKAENYLKAEEYLVKAGEEAMKLAAASEAIDYFREAFSIYLKNSGDEPNPLKITQLYGKIGEAYQLGGKNEQAIEYFEKVLKHYNITTPKSRLSLLFSTLSNMALLIFYVNFPGIRFKRKASDLEKWLLKILYFNGKALYSYDSKRWFMQTMITFRYFSQFSFSSNEYGPATLAAYSTFFNWTGISLSLAEKVLNLSHKELASSSSLVQLEFNTYQKMHQFLKGDWKPDPGMDEFVSVATKRGDIFNLTIYLMFCSFIAIELGLEEETFQNLQKLKSIGQEFESDHTMAQYFRLKSLALFKFRKAEQFFPLTSEGIEFTRKTGHLAMRQIIHSMRSIFASLSGDLETARAELREVEKLVPSTKKIKIWHSTYFLAKAYLLLEELKRNPEDSKICHQLIRTCRLAIKHSKMVPSNLIESHRITGNAFWMAGRRKSAIDHYKRSIKEAERVHGKLEMSRTYFELGKRVSSNGDADPVGGLTGAEYLEKAGKLFVDMGLEYDLKELELFLSK
jgi:class 3 adenylate cyclase/tetratricopeptide (TPR) repeat protein